VQLLRACRCKTTSKEKVCRGYGPCHVRHSTRVVHWGAVDEVEDFLVRVLEERQ